MRILQLHNRYRETGGEDSVVSAEAELLASAGHEVITHHVSNSPKALSAARALAQAPYNGRSAHAVAEIIATHNPDLAHVHNTWYTLSPSVFDALHRAQVPVVMTLHNYRLMCVNALLLRKGRPCEACVGRYPWRGVVHRCYRGSLPASVAAAATGTLARVRRTWHERVDCFIAPSRFVEEMAVRDGIPAEKITLKPHATADPGRRVLPPSMSSQVLFVGRISHEKGADVLIDAWQSAGPPALELILVGDGPERAELESRRVPGVRFLGRRSPCEVQRLMLEARALVFPSICFESFAIVVAEAMAAGLPILATGHGAPAELVAQIGTQWLVPPTDPRGWQAGLTRIQTDELVDSAGDRARQAYESRYTPQGSLDSLQRIYDRVRQQSPAGAGGPVHAHH